MTSLDGKVALITGAARGMGESHARYFAAAGAKVVLADVLESEGRTVADSLGDDAHFVRLDVTSEADWEAAVAATAARFGAPNVLINNAGVQPVSLLADTTVEDFRRCLDINAVGQFIGIKAITAPMAAAGGGSIVNISSTNGFVGVKAMSAYTASKFAVRGLTRCAALELGPLGIRVNSVHPGAVATAMTQDPAWAGVDQNAFFATLPVPRIGQPVDISRMVAWLASDESAYATGAEFLVDGGLLTGGGY
jgi:3alpha(or 20beta)-hydroxysteroid dehydrogenase